MTTPMNSLRPLAMLVVAASLLVPVSASAQRAAAASCGWKPSDAWVARQAEFFDDSKHDWSNDSLRNALLAAAGISTPLAMPVQTGVEIEGRGPTFGPGADAVRAHLKELSKTRGSAWPTRSVVGAAGVHAVYLLTQADTALARAALHRMMEAGPAESPAADVATYEDHMRLVWGRKQIYGTQFKVDANGDGGARADGRLDARRPSARGRGLCRHSQWASAWPSADERQILATVAPLDRISRGDLPVLRRGDRRARCRNGILWRRRGVA